MSSDKWITLSLNPPYVETLEVRDYLNKVEAKMNETADRLLTEFVVYGSCTIWSESGLVSNEVWGKGLEPSNE